jgi:hypothetical protein
VQCVLVMRPSWRVLVISSTAIGASPQWSQIISLNTQPQECARCSVCVCVMSGCIITSSEHMYLYLPHFLLRPPPPLGGVPQGELLTSQSPAYSLSPTPRCPAASGLSLYTRSVCLCCGALSPPVKSASAPSSNPVNCTSRHCGSASGHFPSTYAGGASILSVSPLSGAHNRTSRP